MRKLFLSLALVLVSTFAFANESVKEIIDLNTTTEFVLVTSLEGVKTCYARKCTTYTGNDGYEYKNCTDWEEVSCGSIVLAL
jgi:hypothetical protein